MKDLLDTVNAAKGLADTGKAAADAEKAQAEAGTGALTAKFPGTEVKGLKGTVSVTGNNVGLIEGHLLSTVAVMEASSDIAAEVKA